MITIAQPKKFVRKGFVMTPEVIKVWRNLHESNMLRYVYPIWGTPEDIATQTREIQCSITSMAQTRMARLPWMIRTRFSVPAKFFQ